MNAKINLKIFAVISNWTLQTLIHSNVLSRFIVCVSGRISCRFRTPRRKASKLTLWNSWTISYRIGEIWGKISYSRPIYRPRASNWVKIRSSWSIFSSTRSIVFKICSLNASSLTYSTFFLKY